MLTATYSLVAIRNEQDCTKRILGKLHQGIQHLQNGFQKFDLHMLKSLFNRLIQFDYYCHQRKVQAYLIPAMRKATNEADHLLAELDRLSEKARHMLRKVRMELYKALEDMQGRAEQICTSMQSYCEGMLIRLAKEEQHLFPMASRLLSTDEWFLIAASFLSDDKTPRGRSLEPARPSHHWFQPIRHRNLVYRHGS